MDPATQDISTLYSTVAPGQRSDQVKQLQSALIGAGFNIAAGPTGFFGPQTQAAVDSWKKTLTPTSQTSTTPGTDTPKFFDPSNPATFSLDLKDEPSSDILKKYTSIDEVKKMLDQSTADINKTLTPTDAESKLKTQLADIRQKSDALMMSEKTYENNLQGEGISSGAIQGRSEASARITNLSLENLALQEKNLLTRLGLEQDARTIAEKVAQNKYSNVKDTIEFANKAQEVINKKKTDLITATDKLTDNARLSLQIILNSFKGLTFHGLDSSAQLKVQTMANQLGIPIDIIIKGMDVVKDQQDLDNLDKAKRTAIEQQNANRLSKESGNLNKDEVAFQKDLNAGITKLAENAGNWGQVYDTLAGIYGRTNPDLVKRLTPAEITTAGGDPTVDQTYLDILLNKKKYNPSFNP